MTVVMMGQMSLEDQVEKSEKKNDQDQVDGMKQEVYSKGKRCITKWAVKVIFKEEDDDGRERVKEEEERVSI